MYVLLNSGKNKLWKIDDNIIKLLYNKIVHTYIYNMYMDILPTVLNVSRETFETDKLRRFSEFVYLLCCF